MQVTLMIWLHLNTSFVALYVYTYIFIVYLIIIRFPNKEVVLLLIYLYCFCTRPQSKTEWVATARIPILVSNCCLF